jgi:hypothetical protein
LIRGRPIWFGGKDRSEESMDEFFAWLGPEKTSKIRLAVMDMWKAFRNSTRKQGHAPQALIIFDKFHVLRHLQEALDKVRKNEYHRLTGPGRRFIKGQKYALLSRWRNLTYSGKKALRLLFHANKRLHTAYLLKESFEQLWDYEQPGWARRFFDNWRASLKWQRLAPYERFAEMVRGFAGIKVEDPHWQDRRCHRSAHSGSAQAAKVRASRGRRVLFRICRQSHYRRQPGTGVSLTQRGERMTLEHATCGDFSTQLRRGASRMPTR